MLKKASDAKQRAYAYTNMAMMSAVLNNHKEAQNLFNRAKNELKHCKTQDCKKILQIVETKRKEALETEKRSPSKSAYDGQFIDLVKQGDREEQAGNYDKAHALQLQAYNIIKDDPVIQKNRAWILIQQAGILAHATIMMLDEDSYRVALQALNDSKKAEPYCNNSETAEEKNICNKEAIKNKYRGGSLKILIGNVNEAEQEMNNAFEVAKVSGYKDVISEMATDLAKYYRTKGDTQKSNYYARQIAGNQQ